LGGAGWTHGDFNPLKDDACTKPITTTSLFPAQILGGPLGTMSLDVSTTQINIMVNNVCFLKIKA
jgi:hypothetical protein